MFFKAVSGKDIGLTAPLRDEFPVTGLRHEDDCGFLGGMVIGFIEKMPGRFWGYGYLRPRSEKTVAAKLAGAGMVYYLPLKPLARLHHGSRVVSLVPMIPGYVFVCLDDEERSELKRAEAKFVRIELLRDPYSETILVAELNALHQCELLSREAPVLVNPGIQRGDKVLITSGPLKGLETDVLRREDGSDDVIIVNLTLLNTRVEYPVSAEMLKRITV